MKEAMSPQGEKWDDRFCWEGLEVRVVYENEEDWQQCLQRLHRDP